MPTNAQKSLLAHSHSSTYKTMHPAAKDNLFLYEAIPVSLWVAYPNGQIEFNNDYWLRYTGLTLEECQNAGWTRVVHPDDVQCCARRWTEAFQRGRHFEVEMRVRSAIDGKYRRHLARAAPKFDRQHKIICWFGSCTDIESQCQSSEVDSVAQPPTSEETLYEKRYRLVSDNAPGMIYQFVLRTNGSMEFLFVSSGSRELVGLEPGMIEQDASLILEMIAPENRETFYASIVESSRTLEVWQWAGWGVSTTGVRKWITCSSIPAPQPNGDVIWDGLLMDSTSEKLAQLQIENQRLQLEEANLRLADLNKQLDTLATHDGLTGLKNRRRFQEYMVEEFQRHSRFSGPISLMMVDVDKFKPFNDEFGHVAGDRVLKMVATLLKESTRETDFVARYGGEEFVVVLPRTDECAALMLAERMRRRIESSPWIERAITVSIGVTTIDNTTRITPDDMVKAADYALYESKENGRNRITCSADLEVSQSRAT